MSVNPLIKRTELFKKVEFEKLDVVVIGGGIVGVGVALDAASRGLSVALFEANDFAAGTSSSSSKMFHGGLRYLKSMQLSLVRESLTERDLIINHLAPHLVKPVPFVYPLTRSVWERFYIGSGLMIYDMLARKQLPGRKHLMKNKLLGEFPSLRREIVKGGIQYYDSVMDDARYTLTVARTADRYGAITLNHAPVVNILHDDSGAYGVKVKDEISGEEYTVNSSVVVNCTGVWSEEINKMVGGKAKFHLKPSKGVHVVVARNKIFGNMGMIIPTKTSVLFLIPWKQHWIIGTTDTEWTLDVHYPFATKSDVNYILDTINNFLVTKLTTKDIEGVYSGLRPLITLGAGKNNATSNISRNHGISVIKPGLISIAGGKFTTYRIMAKDTVDTAALYLNNTINSSVTHQIPLVGANGYYTLTNQLSRISKCYDLPVERVKQLIRRYGNMIYRLLDLTVNNKALLQPLPRSETYLLCEIYYAILYEKALKISDVIMRRTRIYIEYPHRGLASINKIAEIMASILEWSESKKQYEIRSYKEQIENEINAQSMNDESFVNLQDFKKYDVINS